MKRHGAMGRREFLRRCGVAALGGAAVAGGAPTAGAQGALPAGIGDYDFLMPRVRYASDRRVGAMWNVYPSADWTLLQRLEKVVRCRVKLPPAVRLGRDPNYTRYGDESSFNAIVDFKEDPGLLRAYPFLFMTGEGYFTFDQSQKTCLKQYIEEGGFLFMDDCVYGRRHDYFYQSSFQALEEVFGKGAVESVPLDHEIFRNVYDLQDVGLPCPQGTDHGPRGMFRGDRLAVFLSSTDLHCAWADYHIGQWFSKEMNEDCLKLGINVLLYAITH